MLFPNISSYPDFQKEAIEWARLKGESCFTFRDFEYRISRDKQGFRVDVKREARKVWFIFTDERDNHYALKVDKEFRLQWVGKILFTTKQALDGILLHDWSGVYSRMFFLIKFGYVPLSHISRVIDINADRPLDNRENKILTEDLVYYYNNQWKIPDWFGVCPFLVRMIYAPLGAKSLLEKIKSV